MNSKQTKLQVQEYKVYIIRYFSYILSLP